MTRIPSSRVVLVASFASMVGCLDVDDLSVQSTQEPVVSSNGVSFNGTSINGSVLNGVYLNGLSFNGLSFNGLSFNGLSFNGLSFNGTVLTGTTVDGDTLTGVDFIGAEIDSAVTVDGTVATLRIDDIVPGAAPNDDVLYYYVSYQKRNRWYPLCGTDNDRQPIPAIPLAGRWNYEAGVPGGGSKVSDPDAITFACRGAALAKCVEAGYKPWVAVADTNLGDHHQACVRMLRADYCGDGTSYTEDGWLINIWDGLGIQLQEDVQDFYFDAEWGVDGAVCISTSQQDYTQSDVRVPQDLPCAADLGSYVCGGGQNFDNGVTLIMDEAHHSLQKGGKEQCYECLDGWMAWYVTCC